MDIKIPPNDVEVEKAVLGSCLIDSTAVLESVERLKPEDFYREDNKIIFTAIFNLASRSEAIDVITVKNELERMKSLDKIGGVEVLASLIDMTPTSSNIIEYAEIVKEKSKLRDIIKAGSDMQKLAFNGDEESNAIISKVQEKIFDLASDRISRGYSVLKDVLIKTYEEISLASENKTGITGLPTGYIDFDRKTAGLQKSNLIILAARPGMGKSALAINIATNIALNGGAVLVFNMEMSKNDIAKRILSSETMIDNQKISTGKIYGEDRNKMVHALSKLSNAEIYIDDTAGIDVMEISAKAKKLKLEKDLKLIVIDYLQLIEPIQKRNQTREQEITTISRALKKLAMELEIPIIALSQLSRSAERSETKKAGVKRPMLSDLRESGAIEQDADMVLFIYRDDYYNKESERKNIAELIIAKHRGGTTGTIDLYWSGPYTKFSNLEIEEDVFGE